jgi:hypothetical protein
MSEFWRSAAAAVALARGEADADGVPGMRGALTAGGFRVTHVAPGGGAARLGLAVGDVIRTVNGVRAGGADGLRGAVLAAAPGGDLPDAAAVRLTVRRPGVGRLVLSGWLAFAPADGAAAPRVAVLAAAPPRVSDPQKARCEVINGV